MDAMDGVVVLGVVLGVVVVVVVVGVVVSSVSSVGSTIVAVTRAPCTIRFTTRLQFNTIIFVRTTPKRRRPFTQVDSGFLFSRMVISIPEIGLARYIRGLLVSQGSK